MASETIVSQPENAKDFEQYCKLMKIYFNKENPGRLSELQFYHKVLNKLALGAYLMNHGCEMDYINKDDFIQLDDSMERWRHAKKVIENRFSQNHQQPLEDPTFKAFMFLRKETRYYHTQSYYNEMWGEAGVY